MDPLRKVVPGDPPSRLLSADRFNILCDVGRWWRNRAGGNQGAGADEAIRAITRLEAWVRSASTLPAFAVVQPTAALIDPIATPENALAWPAFDVAAPTSEDSLVFITTAPHPGGTELVRRAVVQGLAVVEVQHSDESHQFARPIAGSVFRLQSAETGPIRLLPEIDGAGTDAARNRLVLVGAPGGSSTTTPPVETSRSLAWVKGLRGGDRVTANLTIAKGRCACDDNGTYSQILSSTVAAPTEFVVRDEDDDPILDTAHALVICGCGYYLTFNPQPTDAMPWPSLTLTPLPIGSGGSEECPTNGETAVITDWGEDWIDYAFGNILGDICQDDDGPQCENYFIVRVKCEGAASGVDVTTSLPCCEDPFDMPSYLYATFSDGSNTFTVAVPFNESLSGGVIFYGPVGAYVPFLGAFPCNAIQLQITFSCDFVDGSWVLPIQMSVLMFRDLRDGTADNIGDIDLEEFSADCTPDRPILVSADYLWRNFPASCGTLTGWTVTISETPP